MGRVILAAALVVAAASVMTTLAMAAPGQCTVTGFGSFDCDVTLDGGGLTFPLPNGQTFVFALTDADKGEVYLINADAAPGQRPEELREFSAVADQPGCWVGKNDFEFCVLVQK